jgi:glycosyltransferase involved in cell wall biosynthesis
MPGPDLSAIVLCYRAGVSVRRVLEALEAALRNAAVDYELVLVANYHPGQDDVTPSTVRAYAGDRSDVLVVASPKEGAMGWDMRSGFDAARGSTMIVIDGDGQNPPATVLEMFREMQRTGAEVAKGRRVRRGDGPYRRFVSVVYNALFAVLFGVRGVWDVNGKPKGLTRAAYERMTLTSDDWFIDAEIVLEAKRLDLEICEIPVVFLQNESRESFVRPTAIWEFLINMARARFGGLR